MVADGLLQYPQQCVEVNGEMKGCVLSYLELGLRKQFIKEQKTDLDVGSLYNYLENTLGFRVQVCLSLRYDPNCLS